ncbi:MAG: hypothetical protein ABIF08_04460 [Nanoarchaeota archaeon]
MMQELFSLTAQKIVDDYLRILPEERFFIITDRRRDFSYKLSKACYDYASKKKIETKIIVQKRTSYGPADQSVVRLFSDLKKNDCLFICLEDKLGNFYNKFNKGFRSVMRQQGARFATMTGLRSLNNEERLLKAIIIGSEEVRENGKRLKELLDKAKIIELIGKSGTNIRANIENRNAWFNSGEFFKSGTGGNLPSGNIDIFPVEGSVSGKIVIDHSVKIEADTVVLKKPIEFEIENGEIVQIHGEQYIVERIYNDLNNFSFINQRAGFDPRGIFRISGLSFGLLPLQPIGLNLMDERLLGLAAVSNGNSWGKGGRNKCRGHRDHLFWIDHILIDGEKYTVNQLGKLD